MQLARVIGEVVATVKDANLTGSTLARPPAALRRRGRRGADAGGARFGRRRGRRERLLRPRPGGGVPVLSRRAANRRRHRRHRRSLGFDVVSRPGSLLYADSQGRRHSRLDQEEREARGRQAAARPADDARRTAEGHGAPHDRLGRSRSRRDGPGGHRREGGRATRSGGKRRRSTLRSSESSTRSISGRISE